MRVKRHRKDTPLHALYPTSSFEKLMVAEAVITDLGKQLRNAIDENEELRLKLTQKESKKSYPAAADAEISQLKNTIAQLKKKIKDELPKKAQAQMAIVKKLMEENLQLKRKLKSSETI